VGCVHPEDDLTGLKLFVIPHWVIIYPAWVPALRAWVEGGGTLVVGARSGTRDLDNNVETELLPGILRDLCGVTVIEYGKQNRPEERPLELDILGKPVQSRHWYERLELLPGTDALATWSSRHLIGAPAVSLRRLGTGKTIYVGTYLAGAVVDPLVAALAELAGLQPQLLELPRNVEVVQRNGHGRTLWFIVNHAEHAVTIPNVPPGYELVSERPTTGSLTLGPWGVAVIEA